MDTTYLLVIKYVIFSRFKLQWGSKQMREVFRMWKYSNMVALTLFSAAIYAGLLVPFKSIPLIPGYTEIRPANICPVIFGLLFGPAGAWGSAIGNLTADFFGTFSPASIFGFIGNFFFAYIPFKLWGKMYISGNSDKTPDINSTKKLIEFGVVTLLGSISSGVIIAWGSDAMRLVPFATLSTIISLNNAIVTLIFGPIAIKLFFPHIKRFGLLWSDILSTEDFSKSKHPRFYARMILVGSVGGLLSGIGVSKIISSQTFLELMSINSDSYHMLVGICVLPFIILLFFGTSKI